MLMKEAIHIYAHNFIWYSLIINSLQINFYIFLKVKKYKLIFHWKENNSTHRKKKIKDIYGTMALASTKE